jgi:hypothetical protein
MGKLIAVTAIACLSASAAAPRSQVSVVTTDHVDLSPGGVIHIENSFGELSVEAWDEPQAEITVTRYSYLDRDTAGAREAATRRLNALQIASTKAGDKDLTISTPTQKIWSAVRIDYRVRVPRSSSLVIHHRTGDVQIGGVEGDIDATIKAGDILLRLSGAGTYSFDARCGEGTIVSDFPGTYSRSRLIGEKFTGSPTSSARRHTLHVGIGGIGIQNVPAS